jgi:DNA polymerase-3 subunit epsilon
MPSTDRLRALQHARYYNGLDPLFLDTETTGLHGDAQIVEICLIDSTASVLYESLVRPTRSIPWDAVLVHNITDTLVSDAPSWQQVWSNVEEIIRGRYVGIYNAEFDIRMMRQTHALYDIPWEENLFSSFCIMRLYANFFGQSRGRYGTPRWQSLTDAARQCGIYIQGAHRACQDTQLALAVFNCMLQAA